MQMTKEYEIKEIIPGSGLGIIKFGMTRDQLKLILGNPNETENDLTDGIEDEDMETWHYDEMDLSVQFSESTDFRLISLAVSAEFVEFGGAKIIGMNEGDLKKHLRKAGINDLMEEHIEDEDSEQYHILMSDEKGLNFWMEEGEVTEVQWIPLLKDEETIAWPES